MKKRIFSIILCVVCVAGLLALSGCHEAMVSSELKITSREGAGTKTIIVDILDDAANIPVGQFVESEVGNNSKFILKTGDALVTFLKSKVKLAGCEIKSEKLSDRERITLSYSFTSIDDYNAKTKQLADGATLSAATLTVSGDNVTFKENPMATMQSISKLLRAVYNDPTVYDKQGGGDMGGTDVTFEQMARLYNVTYDVAGKKVATDVYDMVAMGDDIVDVSVTGVIKADATQAPGSATNTTAANSGGNNVNTGVENAVYPIVLLVISAAVAIVLKKRLLVK